MFYAPVTKCLHPGKSIRIWLEYTNRAVGCGARHAINNCEILLIIMV